MDEKTERTKEEQRLAEKYARWIKEWDDFYSPLQDRVSRFMEEGSAADFVEDMEKAVVLAREYPSVDAKIIAHTVFADNFTEPFDRELEDDQ